MKLYHTTTKQNADGIKKEGLKPLAKNRPRELQIVDVVFDRIAEDLGIPQRRAGIFAWLTKKDATIPINDTRIVEIQITEEHPLVLHQAWVDLAWGMVGGIFGAMYERGKEQEVRAMEPNQFLQMFKQEMLFEGMLLDVLNKLARRYWQTGVPLEVYNEKTAKQMTADVLTFKGRFRGLLPHLPQEVAIGNDVIPTERLLVLDDK